MEIGFHRFKYFVITSAVLTSAILPALTLVAELPSWNHVFPLNTGSALYCFSLDNHSRRGQGYLSFVFPSNVTTTNEIQGDRDKSSGFFLLWRMNLVERRKRLGYQ